MTGGLTEENSPRIDSDPRPVVALPRQGVPPFVIAAAALVLALGLFIGLDARRRALIATPASNEASKPLLASPPPLVVPPLDGPPAPQVERSPLGRFPSPAPLPPVRLLPAPSAPIARSDARPPNFPPQPSYSDPEPLPAPAQPSPSQGVPPQLDEPRARERNNASPALIFDGGEVARSETPSRGETAGARQQAGTSPSNQQAATSTARAGAIASLTSTIPTGTLIPAVLETPLDTARPGLVRALVTRDTRGFNVRSVLVPRGSRLIGEYQSDVRAGQNRVLINWTRLIRPDGVSIDVSSPAADGMGGSGVRGRVHSFFLQRFANALLQTGLSIGANVAASRVGDGTVIVGLPGGVGNVGQQLTTNNDLRPKITVRQGAIVNVFVARDLDFSALTNVP